MSHATTSPAAPRHVVILGATGSIGRQAIEVAAVLPGVSVVGLVAGSDVEGLLAAAAASGAAELGLADSRAAAAAAARTAGRVHAGDGGIAELIAAAAGHAAREGAELIVLNGIVGAAGLRASLAALEAGATLALANKESMVAGGPFVLAAARARGARIIPVDSEHSAIFQCLEGGRRGAGRMGVEGRAALAGTPAGGAAAAAGRPADDPLLAAEEILLTGSGGPFRGRSRDELAGVTASAALKHPNWVMGPKVTIDSATLMNKGLEVIEAHELFGAPAGEHGAGIGFDQIDVVVHPQSIVHSMVEFSDGTTVAQLSEPDMRLPIGYALAYPDRITTPFGRLDWTTARRLEFEPPDLDAFACLRLAYEAGRVGGTAPAWLNAANEVAVAAFLADRIEWLDIAAVVADTLDGFDGAPIDSFEAVLEADRAARVRAAGAVEARGEAA